MTSKEFKRAWNSIDQSDSPWYTYPLGWSLALFTVVSCLTGIHGVESFESGKRCIWCDKKFPEK